MVTVSLSRGRSPFGYTIACNRWPRDSLRATFRTLAEARLLKVGNAPGVSTYRTKVCTISCLDDRQLRAALRQYPLTLNHSHHTAIHITLKRLSQIKINIKNHVFPCRVAHKRISLSKIQMQGSSEYNSFTKTA
jgi:hypothetical protein